MDQVTKRRTSIVEFVNSNGEISFSQLKEAFPNVSDMTLRTDLKALDEAKQIIRIHGGAKSVDAVFGNDDLIGRREMRNVEEKRIIARKAAALIRPHTTIYLDSGSTTTELARIMPDLPVEIYTTSLPCAVELARLKEARLFVAGGELNSNSLSLFGPHALSMLDDVNFDMTIMGVTAWDERAGFTCGSNSDNWLKQRIIKRAERNIVLMDATKVGHRKPYTICQLADIQEVVSDRRLPEAFLEQCEKEAVIVY
jgi:DeoR family transcriptional regulator of aga operon